MDPQCHVDRGQYGGFGDGFAFIFQPGTDHQAFTDGHFRRFDFQLKLQISNNVGFVLAVAGLDLPLARLGILYGDQIKRLGGEPFDAIRLVSRGYNCAVWG